MAYDPGAEIGRSLLSAIAGATVDFSPLPAGDPGVANTLDAIVTTVRKSSRFPIVKDTAFLIVSGCRPARFTEYYEAIRNYLKGRFRYIPDTYGIEELTAPWIQCSRLRATGICYGDCDDLAALSAALWRACGGRAAVAAVATGKRKTTAGPFGIRWPRPGLDHAIAEAWLGGRWLTMDTLYPSLKPLRKMRREV